MRWQDKAKKLIDVMLDQKNFPYDVVETVRGAILINPQKTDEIDRVVRACNTPKEAIKAVQPYMTEILNNSDPLEIERKFLIRYPDLDLLEQICIKKMPVAQTYLAAEKNHSRRLRMQECNGSTEYWYNEKEKITDVTRIEREREISKREYIDLLCEAIPGSKTINKTRYYIPSGKHCFEVDVFPEWNDRAFAEVELEDENQEFEIPDCISIIKEVTDDGRYTNLSLATNGFVYDSI